MTALYIHLKAESSTNDSMGRNGQFADWFRKQLDRRDLSQADFARLIDMSTGTVSNWATGRRVPDPASCDLIADALGLDLDLVLWQAGHRPPTKEVNPDDPKMEIHGLVDRVPWTPANLKMARRVLRTMIEEVEE